MKETPAPSSDYFLAMPPGPPTQGDIWTNLPLVYHDLPAPLALVITPSCDFAHNKAPLINYIELVPFEEYMSTAGAKFLIEEELARCKESLRNGLNQVNCGALLDMGVDPIRVLEEQKKGNVPDSKIPPKRLVEFEAAVEKMDAMKCALDGYGIDQPTLLSFVSSRGLRQFQERVIRNQISDLHFLPPITPAISCPTVALLRSVSACTCEFLQFAHSCRTDSEWVNATETARVVLPELSRGSQRPERVGRLRSPYLYALIARLGALFGRVGVPDLPASYVISLTTLE